MWCLCYSKTGGRRLDPIEGRETDVKFSHPHAKYRKKISPTKGGHPEKSDEHIISLPEAAGSLPAHSKHGILSMPGDSIDSPRFALKASQEGIYLSWLSISVRFILTLKWKS